MYLFSPSTIDLLHPLISDNYHKWFHPITLKKIKYLPIIPSSDEVELSHFAKLFTSVLFTGTNKLIPSFAQYASPI